MQCSPIDIELNSCLREGALTRVWFGRSVAFLFGLFVRDQAAGEQAAKISHKAFLKAHTDSGTGFGQPRIDLDAMDVDTPAPEILVTVAMAGFSRLPVYEGDLDHVIGFVHIKDLFRQLYLGWAIELRKLLHPALFVPENMTLDRLLELFQEKHNQLAIVLNEYGGTEGMVTLEDVVEEIVGEIRDEHRRHEEQKFVQRDDSSWLLDGAVSVADMIDRLDLKPSDSWEGRGFSTIAGLILDCLGHIPSIGDKAEWDELQLEVVDMDGQRIDRVLVTHKAKLPK